MGGRAPGAGSQEVFLTWEHSAGNQGGTSRCGPRRRCHHATKTASRDGKGDSEPGETETPACQQRAVQTRLNSRRGGRGGVGMPCEAAGAPPGPGFTVPPRGPLLRSGLRADSAGDPAASPGSPPGKGREDPGTAEAASQHVTCRSGQRHILQGVWGQRGSRRAWPTGS